MDFSFIPFVAILIPIVAILGGCTVAIVATISRARLREAEIRERIALIEKGLMPPPEVDPRGFDRAMDRFDRRGPDAYNYRGAGKQRRGGIVLIGVGLGLMVMFRFTGDSDGVGIGGFLAVLGLAFVISSLFDDSRHFREIRAQQSWNPPSSPPTPASAAAPPPSSDLH